MRKAVRWLIPAIGVAVAAALVPSPAPRAYTRYNSGCQSCHGSFLDGTSPKGSTIPLGDKHDMHRSSSYMNTACDLCHASDDSRDPYLNRSDGYADTPGMGCVGCHNGAGLRAHHVLSAVTCSNATCHTSSPAPPRENVNPPYYGSVRTRANDACNLSQLAKTNENWTTGDFVGSDNDGDGRYDGGDPDCSAIPQGPGETLSLRTGHDKLLRVIDLTYDNTTCSATSNNLFYGPLGQVSTYAYSGQVCSIGNTGQYSFDYSALAESVFFVIAAQDGTKEGSYGRNSAGAERPAAGLCPQVQDLSNSCTP